MALKIYFQSLTGLGLDDKDESTLTEEERRELEKKRKVARKLSDKERREKHKKLEEDRERVRQQLREKVSLSKYSWLLRVSPKINNLSKKNLKDF